MKKYCPVLLLAAFLSFSAPVCRGQADNTGQGNSTTGDNSGQAKQAPSPSPIVAGRGAIVVAPAATSASGSGGGSTSTGLIVAAPGAMVIVQQAPAAQKAATKNQTFNAASDSSTITRLSNYANNKDKDGKDITDATKKYAVLARAGAIDALGTLGGADQATITQIACALTDVLENEFNAKLQFDPNKPESKFLCFHAVQSLGKLGWGAHGAIPQMQLLHGQDPILDAAIDQAVAAMQTTPVPTTKQTGNNAGTPMAPAGN